MSDLKFADSTGFAKVGTTYEIDSKAMRKVEDGQDVGVMVENGPMNGVTLLTFTRILVKLH